METPLVWDSIIDGFVKSPISALCAISEEYHVHLSTLNSSKIAQALILAFLSRLGVISKPSEADFLRDYQSFKRGIFKQRAEKHGMVGKLKG